MMNWTQIVLGVFFLLVGSTVYFTDRLSLGVYFIKESGIPQKIIQDLPSIFGPIGNNLPSLTHVLAFILITAGLATQNKRGYFIVCFIWLCIDWLFELGQLFPSVPVKLTPAWFEKVPFFENTKSYFLAGTFDWKDMFDVYKPINTCFTIECSNIFEAYLVIDDDNLIGFYLPVEDGYVFLDKPIKIKR